MLFLDKDSDQVVTLEREGHLLKVHGFDEAIGGDLAIFYGLHQVGGDSSHSLYLGEGGVGSCSPIANLVADLEAVGKSCWVPRDAGYDGVSVCLVDDMKVYPECQETHPFFVFAIP
ncbi:unnamed protein product [Sphagnum jensenii]|uniref:Uncharacterized protein n=1 Tax=Sphagnum jensenii TaxID=128206 RepID=A0ABP1ASM0_9BRYO